MNSENIQHRIEELLADKVAFDAYVYTPWREALAELEEREHNDTVTTYIKAILPHGFPRGMEGKKSMVLGRQVATPNYEMYRFMMCADVMPSLQPLIFEYLKDKFVSLNPSKLGLGKLCFYKQSYSDAEAQLEYREILNMKGADGRPLSALKTHWGQSLIEFHHRWFLEEFPMMKGHHIDISEWLSQTGISAFSYYKAYLAVFLKDAVLFENFLHTKSEGKFTKNVVLPAIIETELLTGKKPLIVALEPTDNENDSFWLSYPFEKRVFIDTYLKR